MDPVKTMEEMRDELGRLTDSRGFVNRDDVMRITREALDKVTD